MGEQDLLVHDNGRSLIGHLDLKSARHTPTSLEKLCDSFEVDIRLFNGLVVIVGKTAERPK